MTTLPFRCRVSFLPIAIEPRSQKESNVGLMGANTAQQFISGLLDEIHLHLVPVLFGESVRLFDHLGIQEVDLELTRVLDSPGVTHLWLNLR